jgi:putative flippase GtrA
MRETIGQVGRYLIGAFIALAIDASIVSVGVKLGAPVIVARLIALLAGVTTTYFFNRRYTFVVSVPASLANWSRYVAAQSIGTALNFAISTGLLYLSDRSLWQIWGAVLLGAGVGFCVNFFSARRQLHR